MADHVRVLRPHLLPVTCLLLLAACADVKRGWDRLRGSEEPLVLPVLMSSELPFRYPPDLLQQQVNGDVTLRLFIDSAGLVVTESTTVAEHALHAAFDSSALEGAGRLVFQPARRGERSVGQVVLFPIKFRVPGTPPDSEQMGARK